MSHELTHLPCLIVRHHHLRNQIDAEQLSQDAGIDLIRLDPRVRNGFDLHRVGDDHLARVRAEQRPDRPGMEGGFENDLVVGAETSCEGLDGLGRGGHLRLAADAALAVDLADLDESFVSVQTVEHVPPLLVREHRGVFGDHDNYLFALAAHPGGS